MIPSRIAASGSSPNTQLERLVAVRRGDDVIAAMRQALGDQPQDVGVVIGDQHRWQRAFL